MKSFKRYITENTDFWNTVKIGDQLFVKHNATPRTPFNKLTDKYHYLGGKVVTFLKNYDTSYFSIIVKYEGESFYMEKNDIDIDKTLILNTINPKYKKSVLDLMNI